MVCLRRDRRGPEFQYCEWAPGFSFPWIRFADCSWPGFLSAVRGNRRTFPGGRGAGVLLVRRRPDAFFLLRMGPSGANLFRSHRDNSGQNPLFVALLPLAI